MTARAPKRVPQNSRGTFCMDAEIRVDILPCISLIPVSEYFLSGMGIFTFLKYPTYRSQLIPKKTVPTDLHDIS